MISPGGMAALSASTVRRRRYAGETPCCVAKRKEVNSMTPKPNKPGLVQLLRAHGHNVPSVRRAGFAVLWQAMALSWADRDGKSHTAYLYLSTVQPVLQIGRRTEPVTLEELERFGLVEAEAQKRSPCAAEADTEAHEDNMMIPQFAALCKG